MLRYMDRSTIHYLKHKGWTNTQIAAFVGHHRDTITRVLREPLDRQPAPRQRSSAIAVFHDQILTWLDQRLSVQRMLELARADPDHPYTGSTPAFYVYVRPLKLARTTLPAQVVVRFEGLPGELLQIDWGEVRQMPFTRAGLHNQTRYFFAARLKYSRWMWVRFTSDMRSETLLRCLIACCVDLGGVPWVVTTDNIKTVTLGRDAQHQPIWHPAFQKLAVEFGFHPDACSLAAGNQKGAVESLVKFVKGNLLAGRTFYDDEDLAQDCAAWLYQVNHLRPSDATDQLPITLLAQERSAFNPLPAVAHDYGIFDTVLVNRESLVNIATNRYSVPCHLVGFALTVRIHAHHIALFQGTEQVALHPRHRGRGQRIVVPEHYEAVFAHKPRARVMVYRDWLLGLGSEVADYLSLLCRKRYNERDTQVCSLYALAQQLGVATFVSALSRAAEQQAIGAEYILALATAPAARPSLPSEHPLQRVLAPPQSEVERPLADYEQYVANRAAELVGAGGVL
jgi:transposase